MAEIFAQVTQFPNLTFEQILKTVKQQFEMMSSGFAERIELWTQTEPNSDGVTLNPVETFSAVIGVIRNSYTVWDSYEQAICLGGDTDTVAALSGAFTALKFPNTFYELDFVKNVDWNEISNWKDFVNLITGGSAN
jgi:ADP-ribosylglycohydrolase